MSGPSRVVAAAVAVGIVGALTAPATATPLGAPADAATEWIPGPEDGPATLDAWPDGEWDVRLAGAYVGQTPEGRGDLEAVGATRLTVDGAALVAAAPFELGLYGEAASLIPEVGGSADVSWVYAGDVAATDGRVVLRAGTLTWTLTDLVIGGQEVPFPPETYDAADVFPLLVTSATCGLVQGTWEGDAVQGMMEAGAGSTEIAEDRPRSFRAVSSDVDEEWLERVQEVADRIDALDPLAVGFLVDLDRAVFDAESLAHEASGGPCADSFSLGIDAQVQDKLRALLEGTEPRPDELWRLAELLARSGILPGSPAHGAAVGQLGRLIDALAPGDVGGAVELLQVALALGDTAAAARLQARLGDPGGALPGTWLEGL